MLNPSEMKYLDILQKHRLSFQKFDANEIWRYLNQYWTKNVPASATAPIANRNPHAITKHVTQQWMSQLGMEDHQNTFENTPRMFLYRHISEYVEQNEPVLCFCCSQKGKEAASSMVQSYTTYPKEIKGIFNVKNLNFNEMCECLFLKRTDNLLRKGYLSDEIKAASQRRRVSKVKKPDHSWLKLILVLVDRLPFPNLLLVRCSFC
ncbi:hypothetical protein RFI_20698 [Reticulomyxa filosa]|uniref:ATP-dependent rRNA helicase SPB4-like C-terminal extension domain-containing protein n=1 Tax=Reticulomyxa filosa TaxID=46433 RepID=X6MSH1_RETFI|nr:hypothetical protein RFI_20698 [Reticulomyxa filosa]|eukprot:ETO16641.1 hypothetical protein RFI_20698 [Reticulomyxa filosa]